MTPTDRIFRIMNHGILLFDTKMMTFLVLRIAFLDSAECRKMFAAEVKEGFLNVEPLILSRQVYVLYETSFF